MPFEISFVWEGKEYRAEASRHWRNGLPYWKVAFPSGKYYEFTHGVIWVHSEHYTRQMPAELKNTICWAIERHPEYRAEMER